MSMLWTLVFPTVKWGGWTRTSWKFCLAVRLLILSRRCCVLNIHHPSRDLSSYPACSWPASLCSHIYLQGIHSLHRQPFLQWECLNIRRLHLLRCWNLPEVPLKCPAATSHCPHRLSQSLERTTMCPFSLKPVVCEPVEFLNRGWLACPSHSHQASSRHRFCGF